MAGNPGIDNQSPLTGKRLNSDGDIVNVVDMLEHVYDAGTGALKTTATLTGEVTLGSISIKDHTADNYQAVNATGEASVTVADGSDVAVGAKADAAVTNPALAGSVVSVLKGILTNTKATVLAAGTAVIGKFGLQVGGTDIGAENPVPVTVANNLTVGTSALPTGAATQTTLAEINTATGVKTDAAMTDETASNSIVSCLKGIYYNVKAIVTAYKLTQAFVTMDTIHHEVHEGEAFQASHIFTNVADTASVYLHITAGSVKAAHANLSVVSLGKALINTYLNPTYSNVGTQALIAAMKTDVDIADRTANVLYTPAYTVIGTQRLMKLLPGGTTVQTRAGASFNSSLETVISPNDDILVQVQNVSGAASDIEVSITWYERTV